MRLGCALVVMATLTACADPRTAFQRDPQVSDISVSGSSIPEANFVQIPMPPPEPPRMMHRAEAASLWQRSSGGFFADQRAARVGDILTIDIRIDDRAQMRNATRREREGSGSAGIPSIVGLDNLPTGDIIDLSSSFEASGSGQINRGESINLKVAALVTQSLPNGNLVIAGRQEVKVNQELREKRWPKPASPMADGVNCRASSSAATEKISSTLSCPINAELLPQFHVMRWLGNYVQGPNNEIVSSLGDSCCRRFCVFGFCSGDTRDNSGP